MIKIHFTDFFQVDPVTLESYGAFNISLINDLPLFIDPFLLFNSQDKTYQNLHREMIRYLAFLRRKSDAGDIKPGLLEAWFTFREVKQNWFGYSLVGNQGSGLGLKFARALNRNLSEVFTNFGAEQVTQGSHLEKLCLIDKGVGRDCISDFTTNLIKEYLLSYTQKFALKHVPRKLRDRFNVEKTKFNYETETWVSCIYELPSIGDDYILLTPKDILTKDDVWINRKDLYGEFRNLVIALPNDQLRDQLSNYFLSVLPKEPNKQDQLEAIKKTIRRYPELIEYFIRSKEKRGDEAISISDAHVTAMHSLFVEHLNIFAHAVAKTNFYSIPGNTKEESRKRVEFLKDIIENKGGWKVFYVNGRPIRRESDLHILFRLTWFGTPSDISHEVDDGRGPADFKASRGRWDKTIIEFKLAKNTHLKQNLQKQTDIYQSASNAQAGLRVILYFTDAQLDRVMKILRELNLIGHEDIILIDGTPKSSASKAE